MKSVVFGFISWKKLVYMRKGIPLFNSNSLILSSFSPTYLLGNCFNMKLRITIKLALIVKVADFNVSDLLHLLYELFQD